MRAMATTPGEAPTRRVLRRVVLPAAPFDVWAALTRPAELSRWFGAHIISVDARPGGRLVMRDAQGGLHRAAVETAEPGIRFAFQWLLAAVGPAGAGPDRGEWSPGSRVEFVIEETGEGTVLTVVETAPAYGSTDLADAVAVSGPIFSTGSPQEPPGTPPLVKARV